MGLPSSVAMGGYTPLYRIVYHLIPGFSFIRAPSKFLFFASVFAALLVGLGIERLWSSAKRDDGDPGEIARTSMVALAITGVVGALFVFVWAAPRTSSTSISLVHLMDSLRGAGDFHVEGAFEVDIAFGSSVGPEGVGQIVDENLLEPSG